MFYWWCIPFRSLYALQQDVKWLEILMTELDNASGLWVTKVEHSEEEDDSEGRYNNQ